MAEYARRKGHRLMSQINVVPYIDVMLVLLVIFMVTAPLITTTRDRSALDQPQQRAAGGTDRSDHQEQGLTSWCAIASVARASGA